MLDTFKARLKAKLKTLGVNLSQKRIDAIADRLHKKSPDITDEKDHDSKIDDLNDVQPFDDLAKLDDKIRTLEAKGKEKKDDPNPDDDDPDDDEKDKGKGKKKKPADDEAPAWAKKILQEMETLKADKTKTSIQAKLAEKLKGKVPEKFYNKRQLPEKEDDLDDFVTEVIADFTDFKQDHVNTGLANNGTPAGGNGSPAATGKEDKDIEEWASKESAKNKTEKTNP